MESIPEGSHSLKQLAGEARAAHPSTPELIASVVKEAIVGGVLPPGTQLRQGELAADFGVSIIPVREALQKLEAQGFVVLHRNRGAVVPEISLDEIRELFDIRIALETMVIRLAIPKLSEADLGKAERYMRALDGEADINRWGHWNWLFHEALYAAAGRKRTLDILRNLHNHIDRVLRLQMSLEGGQRKSHREHQAILKACRARDADRAVAALTGHIAGVAEIILRFAARQELQKSTRDSALDGLPPRVAIGGRRLATKAGAARLQPLQRPRE